jgi:hypothetical protein
MNWTALDDAIAANLQHAPMNTADPLTDSLFTQLEAPAAEGALPPLPYSAGRATALAEAGHDPALRWVLPLGLLAGLLLSAAADAGWLPW